MSVSAGSNRPDTFTDIQYRFTRHMRDPDNAPAPADIEDRRMAIYRDLLYRNVESFLANSFPVLRKILDDDYWHGMIRDYFRDHLSHTPLFPKMPQEFLQYLQEERVQDPGYPYLWELAHYEWVELALSIDNREIRSEDLHLDGDLLEGIPVLSELAWALQYRYPVHRISPDWLPDSEPEQPTYLVVYRDRQDEVGFLELNPVAARLLQILAEDNSKSGREVLVDIATELNHPEPDVVVTGGLQILEDLRQRHIVLGTEQTPAR